MKAGMLAYYALRFWVQTPALQDKEVKWINDDVFFLFVRVRN